MPEPLSLEQKQRQVAYWRLIGSCFGLEELSKPFEDMVREFVRQEELPLAILDGSMSIEVLLNRNPSLKETFAKIEKITQEPDDEEEEADPEDEAQNESEAESEPSLKAEPETEPDAADPSSDPSAEQPDMQRTLAYSKLLLNVFGPNTRTPSCSAKQYSQWSKDVEAFERCFGFAPGSLRGKAGIKGGPGGGPGGNRELIDDEQLRDELIAMESDLVQRMDLREVLADDELAKKITPTSAVVEQLLYDKSNLSGKALANARALVRKYVDDLAAVLKKQVVSASTGKIDRSIPPKRIFRNLDLKRTVWKNLPNYNPEDGRIYVDQLYYRHTAQSELNNYLIVVVDQSGSMVDAMTQCAILASIFAALPRIKVSLIAFDTSVIDLTPWVDDPFEALMRTNLGGGNDGPLAMLEARQHVINPQRTTMVWISDFYEHRALLPMVKSEIESGVHFIPVGSVSGSGYYSVDSWFKAEFKKMGCPILTGNIKKLIVELKKQLR